MNTRQLLVLWIALLILTSMLWFPGRWFGYIIAGYPSLIPESLEFVVRVVAPYCAAVVLLLYALRNRKGVYRQKPETGGRGGGIRFAMVLFCGLLVGFIAGFFLIRSRETALSENPRELHLVTGPENAFKNFCKREQYRKKLEQFTDWIEEQQASEIAILYDGDDPYSRELYRYLSQKIKDLQLTLAFTGKFKRGGKFFYTTLRDLEKEDPDAILFLGTHEDRLAFLESIAENFREDFWKERIERIKWVE